MRDGPCHVSEALRDLQDLQAQFFRSILAGQWGSPPAPGHSVPLVPPDLQARVGARTLTVTVTSGFGPMTTVGNTDPIGQRRKPLAAFYVTARHFLTATKSGTFSLVSQPRSTYPPGMTPEGRVKAKLKRRLEKQYGDDMYWFMPVQSGMGATTLDVLCCIRGLFVGIETKRDAGHKVTGHQAETIRRIRNAGGIAEVVYDDATIEKLIDAIDRKSEAQSCARPRDGGDARRLD